MTHIIQKTAASQPQHTSPTGKHWHRLSSFTSPTFLSLPAQQLHTRKSTHHANVPRNSDRKVSFNDEVKVCATNDIDVLRKHGSVAATLQVPPFTSNKSNLYTEPKLKYVTHTIKSGDEPARSNGGYFRKGAHYEPGKWAPSKGSDAVNTSGSRVKQEDYDAWKCYVRSLQLEAQELDCEERHVLDQEAFLVFLCVSKQIQQPVKGLLLPLGKGLGTNLVALPFALMRREWQQLRKA